MDIFSRSEILLGEDAMNTLKSAHIAIFGLGGVGGYTAEALARSGVGTLTLVDSDVISETNINRQIYALNSTLGMDKTDVAEARLLDINPNIKIIKRKVFYLPETENEFDFSQYDYVADAVDTVAAKAALAENAQKAGTPIIAAMGTGNKINPEMLEVADIYKTTVCPLARAVRRECKARGVKHLKCVYSKEKPLTPLENGETKGVINRPVPGSTAFVPSVAGLIMAAEIVKDLIK